MGCTQSKIENEEINRCKDRKMFMKVAVSSRNAFAAAHFAYTMSLKNTGAALSDYSQGEVDGISSSVSSSLPPPTGPNLPPPVPPQAPYDNLPPPPPPLPNFTPSPLQRASSMPEFVLPKPDLKPHTDPIIEEDEEGEIESESVHGLRHRSSSRNSGGGGGGGGGRKGMSSRDTDSENLTPPPPPKADRTQAPPPPPPENRGVSGMSWDFFFPSMENVPGPSLAEVDENRIEREEIERKVMAERSKRSEMDGGGGRRNGKAEVEPETPETVVEPPPPPTPKPVKKVRQAPPPDNKRAGKGGTSINLVQIFNELDDCFLKASESAHEVSKMLEANRLHYHSNFADNRGHIDHSARVMRVITWNRSFRGLPNADDGVDDFDSEEHETHATVLDKMLAWEKKLYDEVKAGEQMKFEYQKKIASLNKLKKRGASTESLERTKATVSHLHTRYIVDMQSMDSTVSEINRLRDEQLYPKLVVLVDGMATMWDSMRTHHESQTKIVQALRYLDLSNTPKETSDHHHERTVQLWAVVQEWHSQFDKLMFNQKEYIKALNSWLKLNLIPIDNNLREKVSSPQRPQSPPILALLQTWNDYLEKLPEELAKTAIYNFAAVINTIVQYQAEEMKLRDKCEDTRKELKKKSRQFEDWYSKYMQKRTPADDMDPDRAHDKELIAERQMAVEILKKRLEEEEEDYQRLSVQVRDKSFTSLRTRLPEVFRAMSDFSYACSHMYRSLRPNSRANNSNRGS